MLRLLLNKIFSQVRGLTTDAACVFVTYKQNGQIRMSGKIVGRKVLFCNLRGNYGIPEKAVAASFAFPIYELNEQKENRSSKIQGTTNSPGYKTKLFVHFQRIMTQKRRWLAQCG